MKRALICLALLAIIGSSAGRGAASDTTSYRDIPGVTAEEISAIEALKTVRKKFSYGAMLATEAFILPDGSQAGFTIKLCALLTKLFGLPFVPEICEWDDMLNRLNARSLDFTGELTPTEERMLTYGMSFPIAERMLRIFMHADSNAIQTETDLNGLKIGFLEGSITADSIKKAYPVAFQPVDVENYHNAAMMIRDGEIDAFIDEGVSDPVFSEYPFVRSAVFFPMVHSPVSMTTANPDLAPIISVLNKYIASGGVDKLYALYKEGDLEYARHKLHRSFTDEEKAYMDDFRQRGAAIGVAFELDNYPVGFYNTKEKEFQGIAADVLKEISRLTDMQFEMAAAHGGTWAEILDKLESGEIHMVAQLLHSKARIEHFLWGAVPYSRSYYAIMSKADYPNLASYQVVRATVGVMKKSGHEDIYRELFPNNNNLREYDTLWECLEALEKGEVALLMGSEHMLITQNHYHEKSGFKINIKLNVPMDSYFGFHKNDRILCSIIGKAQQYVPTETIEIAWTSRMFDYSKKLAEERAFFLAIFVSVLSLMLAATVVLLVRDVRLNKKLKDMANTDSLTGIFNRRCFMEMALAQIERTLRMGGECFVIILDLDHFKNVNDHYGHLAGDKVLRETAQRVKQAIRPYDLFGRYGGEEFILLVPDVDKESVLNVAERIRQDICKTPIEYEGRGIPVSASFGIAYAAPVNNLGTATKSADEALYQAKENGRNRVVFHGDGG
ncbi:MAG: GGDEF domain-containing protein [Desulfovibrionaceae bacterium]|nr:GGDEF domain-containing protein [Desulfovibrionaceae bacterium]